MTHPIANFMAPNAPFALIRFQEEDRILHLSGSIATFDKLADIPRKKGKAEHEGGSFDTLSILPYRQVEELGFLAHHEDEKILTLQIKDQAYIPLDEMLAQLPEEPMALDGEGTFTPNDTDFTAMNQRIIDEDIGEGAGCNFVVPRTYKAKIANFDHAKALSVFRRLLENEYGTYWTFLYFTGDRYFIGATPERHLSYKAGQVKMNPISGTFRKMDYTEHASEKALNTFLSDPKETFELLMTVDEELKMMAEVCSSGGQVVGPMVKEMSKLIHTEYVLVGQSDRDVVEMLRESMFAATVVGSPIENACRVNYRHNKTTRSYYGSALALLGRDETGDDTLDSPITIRTVEMDVDGSFEIRVGASIVRDSDSESETRESAAKARGMMAALGISTSHAEPIYRLGRKVYNEDQMIKLSARNAKLSRFWIEDQSDARHADSDLQGKKVTIIDNEDNFTRMLAHMMRPLGVSPKIVKNADYDVNTDDADLVVLGPGPGDPSDMSDERIVRASGFCKALLERGTPLFCVCLGHQILCHNLGFELAKKTRPFQGAQELIDLFGVTARVGFYNTFTAMKDDKDRAVELSYDEPTGEVHALRGKNVLGLQFHPESILTTDGNGIIHDVLRYLITK